MNTSMYKYIKSLIKVEEEDTQLKYFYKTIYIQYIVLYVHGYYIMIKIINIIDMSSISSRVMTF